MRFMKWSKKNAKTSGFYNIKKTFQEKIPERFKLTKPKPTHQMEQIFYLISTGYEYSLPPAAIVAT